RFVGDRIGGLGFSVCGSHGLQLLGIGYLGRHRHRGLSSSWKAGSLGFSRHTAGAVARRVCWSDLYCLALSEFPTPTRQVAFPDFSSSRVTATAALADSRTFCPSTS